MSGNNSASSSFLSSFKQFVGGGAGGICLILVGHPMDTIKVRMQTMRTPRPGEKPAYKGTIDCVSKMLRKEGFRGFYRGMLAPLIGATPVNSMCFMGYGFGVRLQSPDGLPTSVGKLSYFEIFRAGMLSGMCAASINAPVERVKCLLQVQNNSSTQKKYQGFWDCTQKVYRTGGIPSLYKGLSVTMARDIPSSGVYFVVYEWCKKIIPNATNLDNTTAITLVSGGLAGVLFWVVAIPADVIKSKYQTDFSNRYSNIRAVIRSMRSSGIGAFYRGSTPVLLRSFPANAACFFGYEWTMIFLNKLLPQ